ncbi:MAG: hypothetical protein F6J93_19900 [Oscillatoria sp. SIO1A7]|nr:hypothetical protein [Oscillatoria sp. SIO1A7]
MENWDANYIHNKFDEVNARLTILQKSVSEQTHLLERKIEDLSNKISDQKTQGNNGGIKIATLSGIISAALFEIIQVFVK